MSNAAEISTGDRLSFTIFVAIAVHALIVFGISFGLNSGPKIAPTLNITIANHKSEVPPEKADFIAQHNQQASGTINEVKELTVRDRAEIQDVKVRDINPQPQIKASTPSENTKRVVTTKSKAKRIEKIQNDIKESEEKERREGMEYDTQLAQTEYASLKAKLDDLQQEFARQPRIRRLTSLSTKAADDALYLGAWADKIAAVGTQNFPEVAMANRIFGNLRLAVVLLPDGSVESIELLQSSGYNVLDEAAKHIVHLASPFAPFPREIQKNTDRLEIIRTWRFEITGLKTTQ